MAPSATDDGRRVAAKTTFPPRWVSPAINALLLGAYYGLVTALAVASVLGAKLLREAYTSGDLIQSWSAFSAGAVVFTRGELVAAAVTLAALIAVAAWWRREPCYLVDFECFRPDPRFMVPYSLFEEGSRSTGRFTDEAMDFQVRILNKAALSEETFFPEGMHMKPPRTDMALARAEAELVMFSAVSDLLARTGLHPRQIDVLVVNCSLFNPTPSLSAMIINHFKMRSDIESYSLGGMGCSAGIISVGLARKLLRTLPGRGYALVVSTENITQNWYLGSDRSMLIPNTIFRMGAAAVLLSNRRTERSRALYELESLVRVHLGADDKAYRCVYQHADAEGTVGVELNKDLVAVAARSMEVNLTRLGPLVLPWGEKLAFAANWAARRVSRGVAPYVPDFRRAFDHFCLHVGGRGVVEGLSKQLHLDPRQQAPSVNTLYWYGNTSSSTVWYSFGYVESAQGVKKGDRVWQIGFGSGFKCNSAVWRALRPVRREHGAWRHLQGREAEAVENLKRIQEEGRREKAAKQAAAAAAAGEVPMQNGSGGENGNGRALRSRAARRD